MSKLYVQLGRAGDVVNILPLLHADFKHTGEKPRLMVAKEFSSILDGCSYIDRVVFDGDYKELGRAMNIARGMSKEVVVTSLHGSKDDMDKVYAQIGQKHAVTTNFVHEAWNLAKRLNEWGDNLPLVFDRRDAAREKRLLDAHGFNKKGHRKPVILLAIDGGVTAPFPYAHLLRELVTLKFGKDYRILDLPMVEKPDGRIYDLLALYEKSALLIATDSMPLHLAWVCRQLPVFALCNDKPSLWHGSPWRPNHLWFCRYHDWPERAVEMLSAIEWLPEFDRGDDFVTVFSAPPKESYTPDRCVIPIRKGMANREADGFPFVRDAIMMAFQRAGDTDSIILARDTTTYKSDIREPIYAYRLKTQNSELATHNLEFHPIVDLFSAPKAFWKKILPEIPDLILDNNCYFWSQALMAIFKKHGATDATGSCQFVGGAK